MKTCPQCETGYPDSHTTCPTHGLPLNEIRDLKPGMVIHQSYRILRKLGQGGMGAVYLAQHTLMNEPQALKFLSSELSHDEAFTARFLREVRTLRQIRHKNVVDAGNLEPAEDGTLFFSMEYVDGPDLRAFLNNSSQYLNTDCHPERSLERSLRQTESKDLLLPLGALPVELALHIARQIAEGLGAAHLKGMVHRDIKPENILMARDAGAWLPKIADFGIVATKESSTAYTRTGGTLLTMAYAAPEQWRGTPAASLDGRTDLYALGGLLYEMLTGQTPFHAENYEGWSRQHQTTPPQPPSALRPDLANWQGLDALVLRLLAKDRNHRPKDVVEVLGLIDAVRLVPSEARRETVKEDGRQVGGKRSRRVLIWVWAASAAMFLVAGFFTARIFLLRLRPGPQPQPSSQQSSSPKVAQVPEQPAADPYLPISIPLTPPAAHPAPKGKAKPIVQKPEVPLDPNPASELTWTDPATGLMWTKEDNGSNVDWQQATDYCRNLQLDGRSGWRLPTIAELRGIYDPNANVPWQWADGSQHTWHVKGNLHLSGWEWSSSQGNVSGEAWTFFFYDGERDSNPYGNSNGTPALCVRRSGE